MRRFILKYYPVLFIIVIWFIFAHPYFIKQRVPFPSTYLVSFFNPWVNYYGMPVKNNAMPDVITQLYPWKKITIDALKEGTLPLWNPYQFSGNPHLANVQSAPFTPFNLLFFTLPFLDAWSILVLFQPMLAGLFMLLYLRFVGKSKLASIVGSVSFMFSSFIVTWMAYATLAYALLYLPLLLYGIERLVKNDDWMSKLIIAGSIPLSLFSGHFQTSFYALLVGLLYFMVRSISTKRKKVFVSGLISILLGIAISSVQLIPAIQFYSQSERSESFDTGPGILWTQIIRIIAPDIFGNPVTRNDWVGYYAEWGTYAGVIPFFLTIIAVSKRKDWRVYFFGILFLFALLLAYNNSLISLISDLKIPVLSTSNPSRIVGIISFSIACLSAFGFDYIREDWKKRAVSKNTATSMVIGIILFLSVWLLIFSKSDLLFSGKDEFIQIAKRNFIIPTILFGGFIFSFIAGLHKFKFIQKIALVFLVTLTSFEMLRFGIKWMPFEPREYMYPEIAPLTYLQDHAHENRVYGLFGNEVYGMFSLYGIEGYDPLYIKRYGELITAAGGGTVAPLARSAVVFPRTSIYAKEMLDFLGVKYILHSKGDGQGSWLFPFWSYPESYGKPVFSDEKYEIYENRSVYPRAYLVNNYHVLSDPKTIIETMFSGKIDLRKEVIVEEAPTLPLEPCSNNGENEAVIVSYRLSEVVITTKSSCSSILFMSDVFYPGWIAYVDGNKTTIQRANYTFRGVPLNPGEHTVIMKYENWYL